MSTNAILPAEPEGNNDCLVRGTREEGVRGIILPRHVADRTETPENRLTPLLLTCCKLSVAGRVKAILLPLINPRRIIDDAFTKLPEMEAILETMQKLRFEI